MLKYPMKFAAAVAGSLVVIAPSFTFAAIFDPREKAAPPQVSATAPPSAPACYVPSPSGKAPTVGVYRAKVWVTAANGCGFNANDPIPEFTYYYGGPGSPASYYAPGPWAPGEIYTETGYTAPSGICTDPQAGTLAATVTGQATSTILPAGATHPVTYSEKWTYVDPNSFIVTGHYSAASCVADETIVYIRTGR
jgi:hypothetical protein